MQATDSKAEAKAKTPKGAKEKKKGRGKAKGLSIQSVLHLALEMGYYDDPEDEMIASLAAMYLHGIISHREYRKTTFSIQCHIAGHGDSLQEALRNLGRCHDHTACWNRYKYWNSRKKLVPAIQPWVRTLPREKAKRTPVGE